jgi:GTP pyrophosphokinase
VAASPRPHQGFHFLPRPNGYQSLHTSVIAGGQPFEVQIRTSEMHRIAEEGIAAHWKYKGGKLVADSKEDERVSWLRHLGRMATGNEGSG